MKSLKLTIQNKIAHIELIRPKELNTMNEDFWIEFPKVIDKVNTEASARVIVLSSNLRGQDQVPGPIRYSVSSR